MEPDGKDHGMVTIDGEGGSAAPEPNRLLRAARERTPSRHCPQAYMAREEVADAVVQWIAKNDKKGRSVAFDANHLGKLERGTVRCPQQRYVDALCAVLKATPAELGFDSVAKLTRPLAAAQPDGEHKAQDTTEQLTAASPMQPEQECNDSSADRLPAVPEEDGTPQRRETLKLSLAVSVPYLLRPKSWVGCCLMAPLKHWSLLNSPRRQRLGGARSNISSW